MRGGDTGNVARVRHHLSDALSQKSVELIEEKELRHWRDELAKKMAPATVNRATTGLVAALNLTADTADRGLQGTGWLRLRRAVLTAARRLTPPFHSAPCRRGAGRVWAGWVKVYAQSSACAGDALLTR